MFEWTCTFVHAFLTIALTVGVIYARSLSATIAILASLLILLCMIRYFGGCLLSQFEVNDSFPTLTEIGRSYSLKDDDAVSGKHFEEIVVSNLLLIHLIGIASRLILPIEILF